jgi:hypothetical protein
MAVGVAGAQVAARQAVAVVGVHGELVDVDAPAEKDEDYGRNGDGTTNLDRNPSPYPVRLTVR